MDQADELIVIAKPGKATRDVGSHLTTFTIRAVTAPAMGFKRLAAGIAGRKRRLGRSLSRSK
jgi:hypothetical protein